MHTSTVHSSETERSSDCTRKGFLSVFTIHCSLQSASGRMFLHAREQDNPSNMRYMGLTVNKYIPDVKQAQSESWEGALSITPYEATKCLAVCNPEVRLLVRGSITDVK